MTTPLLESNITPLPQEAASTAEEAKPMDGEALRTSTKGHPHEETPEFSNLRFGETPKEELSQTEIGGEAEDVDYPSAIPDTLLLGNLFDLRLRLSNPLEVELEQEGEFYIAKCEYLQEFGYSTEAFGAVEDLKHALAELYWSLKGNQDRLGTDLADTWQKMDELIYEA
jgi:hypothetical protein